MAQTSSFKSFVVRSLACGFLISLTGCAPSFKAETIELASHVSQNIGCENVRSHVFDSMYKFLDTQSAAPDQALLEAALSEQFEKLKAQSSPAQVLKFQSLSSEVQNLFRLLNAETQKKRTSAETQLQYLIQLEFENISTSEHIEMNAKLQQSMARVESLAKDLDLGCPTPPLPGIDPDPNSKGVNTPLKGALFAFTTAYQTCDVLKLPEVDSKTPAAEGIGKKQNSDGSRWLRFYEDIRDIQKTHYYIQGMTYAPSCFDVGAKPLVYDYAGVPSVESNRLNFFVNKGGGSALGIDCSAFISAGLAAAGLRYSPGVENKAIYVRQTSRDFLDPKGSNWKCIDKITVTPLQSILPGDIVSIDGHVVMIDRIGSDPFGLRKIQNESQCSQVSLENFDFSVIQSSPSKGDLGLNRFVAKDYLSGTMKSGLLKYAQAACRAKFTGQNIAVNERTLSVVRHKGTPECRAPRIELNRQSCISECFEQSIQ